jgi:hypothetical protein
LRPGKDHKTIATFVGPCQCDTVYNLVPKLLRTIGALGLHNLSFACKLA